MKLYSTNNPNNIVSLEEAVLNSLPVDKGLYLPCELNPLTGGFFDNYRDRSFVENSYAIAAHLIGDTVPSDMLKTIIQEALNISVPLVSVTIEVDVLELFHGPTLAFKDFGARFMARLMAYFNRGKSSALNILVATSGDTGGAVANGFYNVEGIHVHVLYPKGKVSPYQAKQFTTLGDNISAIEIDGTFDDCQRLVKRAFLDVDLIQEYRLSSANSINIARLIPQMFYYFEGVKQLSKEKDVVAVVPSGNLGNLTAGVLAKQLGLGIDSFIAASNSNDTFPRYLDTGNYKALPSVLTLSNAMDVGDPSNFSRLHHLYGSTWNTIKQNIKGCKVSDEKTVQTMVKVYEKQNYLLDPHTAVGYAAIQTLKEDGKHYMLLSTAHPSKFKLAIEERTNISVDVPERLQKFLSAEEHITSISNEYDDFNDYLRANLK